MCLNPSDRQGNNECTFVEQDARKQESSQNFDWEVFTLEADCRV